MGQHFASDRTAAEPWPGNGFVAQDAPVSARQIDHISGFKRFKMQICISGIPISPSHFVSLVKWKPPSSKTSAGRCGNGGERRRPYR
jgi:hypothetical protein